MAMSDWIRSIVLRAMRVPKEPDVPDGSPGSTQVFRAGANFIRFQLLIWFASHLSILVALLAVAVVLELRMFRFPVWAQRTIHAFEGGGFLLLAALWIFTYFQIRLNYEMRWYLVTDRSLRIRSGIVMVQEITMTFANIQEIRVSATPLQVFLGLADVEVHSAGGGGGGPHGTGSSHIGRFQGVDNADAIRDIIVDRLRVYRDSGLGEHPEIAAAPRAEALEAARAVLEEARALRSSLQRD